MELSIRLLGRLLRLSICWQQLRIQFTHEANLADSH